MDVHARCVAILLFFVSGSSVVVAAENAQQLIFMQVGKPTSTQNVNITTVDLKYHNMFWSWGQTGCQFGLGARVGWFEVANESTARLGGGGRIGCQWGHWQTWVPLEMVWLEQHSFGERGAAFKDYGGPFQWRCCPNRCGLNGTNLGPGDLITTIPFKSASWASRFTPLPTGLNTTSL